MENLTICPHCYREITSEDLANYPRKLREQELRDEFEEKFWKRNELILFAGILCGIVGMLLSLLLQFPIAENTGVDVNPLTSIILELVFGGLTVCWAIYWSTKETKLCSKYVEEIMKKSQ